MNEQSATDGEWKDHSPHLFTSQDIQVKITLHIHVNRINPLHYLCIIQEGMKKQKKMGKYKIVVSTTI